MCGIFGQLTNSVHKLDVSAFNILGIFNVDRGKSSCGVTFDDEIYYGLDKDKIYSDFIKNISIKPKHNPSIIGHTRQSSVGAVNYFNSHPFGFGTNNKSSGGFEFIGVHNGTLKNHSELATKYGIDKTERYINNYNIEVERTKIDSEILLEILWKTKSFKVLSEYIGGAALVWTWTDQPNKVYLWSGASKMYEDAIDGKMYEERPLCVYTKSKNNMFISSILDSLLAIGGNENTAHQIDYNTVYTITDGDFANAEKMVVSRRKAFQNETYKSSTYGGYGRGDYESIWDQYEKDSKNSKIITNSNFNYEPIKNDKASLTKVNIFDEKPMNDVNSYGKKVYFNKLRYWNKGHLITGIYAYIKDYGLYKLGNNAKDAMHHFNTLKGQPFIDNDFNFNIDIKEDDFIPFPINIKNYNFLFFIQGVRVKTCYDYAQLTNKIENLPKNKTHIDYVELSHAAVHPIIDISVTTRSILYQGITFEGELYTGNFCPFGSERIYNVDNGNLLMYTTRQDLKVETPVIILPSSTKKTFIIGHDKDVLNNVENNIKELEEEIQEQEKELTSQNDDKYMETLIENQFEMSGEITTGLENDVISDSEIDLIVDNIIDEDFTNPLITLKECQEKLVQYLPNKRAKDSIETIKSLRDIMQSCLISEYKERKNE